MNQQEHAHFNPTNPDHNDSFSANFEQRKYLHEANSFERRAVWNSHSSSCCQPSKQHGRHGEPLYRSLLKPHHCSQPSFVEHVEGAHRRHHQHYLFEAESTAAGNCFSPQYVSYNPCRCGSPMLHESNTRIESKGQSYYPNRALPNEITLYNWYLIRSGDLHTSDIAVGGFLSSRCTEVDRIETTTIVKRLEECKLLTKDGDVIDLVGPIDDYRTVSNGFTLQTAHLFISGFPHIWNLLVGMELPAKAAGTITSSQSCDFHGGEITFQERLKKETSGQRGYMQHFSAFKGLETDLVSYPEGERSCGAKHATEAPGAEANEKVPETAVNLEQDIGLLDGECQSKEDPLILHNRVQKKESDKNAGAEGNCVEGTEHEASHGQKSTTNGLTKATALACELDNMPIESLEAAVSEIALGNKESEEVTEKKIKNGAKEKNHANKAFVEATADADADAGAEADKLCSRNLNSATVQPFQMSGGELGMAKLSKTLSESSPKKRKVAFSSANDVEGGDVSSASLSLENSARSMEKSCSLSSQKEEELISSVISIDKRKGVVAKKATAKKKGKHKRRGRILLARSKRSTKPTPAEAIDLACGLENMPIESMEVAVSEIAFGNKESEVVTEKKIKNGAKDKNHANEAFVEVTADVGAEDDKECGGNPDFATVQPFQISEGELGMGKASKTLIELSPRKKKVSFSSANDVESGDLSSASHSLENSARSMEKSCSLVSQKEEELISSAISIDKQKGIVAKEATAKKKRKHKRRGRVLLARSKRSTKAKVQVDFKRREDAVKQPKDSSHEEQLDRGFKKRKSRKLREGQVATVAEDDLPTGNTAEQISDSILVIKTRKAPLQRFNAKKGLQIKSIAKKDVECFVTSQDSISQRSLKNSPEKLETLEVKDSSLPPDSSKVNCIDPSHDGNGPSARKRMKMLPPPLPSPLVSVSKQLVSKAFGLKTSKSGRLLVPPLAHWRGQSLVRDMDGGIIAIEDGSHGTSLETGCFNFKPPIEARAKKLQEWLSETASKCLTKKLNARRKGNQPKSVPN